MLICLCLVWNSNYLDAHVGNVLRCWVPKWVSLGLNEEDWDKNHVMLHSFQNRKEFWRVMEEGCAYCRILLNLYHTTRRHISETLIPSDALLRIRFSRLIFSDDIIRSKIQYFSPSLIVDFCKNETGPHLDSIPQILRREIFAFFFSVFLFMCVI